VYAFKSLLFAELILAKNTFKKNGTFKQPVLLSFRYTAAG